MKKHHVYVDSLMLNIGQGMATIDVKGEVHFEDCVPLTVDEMEFIVEEAKRFIKYRKRRWKATGYYPEITPSKIKIKDGD